MALSLAADAPESAKIANLSPLHLQLLLMMGSCHNHPGCMEEAKTVQKILHLIEPDEESEKSAPAGKKKKKTAESTSGWTTEALAKLAASTNGTDLLQLAMLHDPALPWHPKLHDPEKCMKYYGLAAIKMPSTYACARLAHFCMTGLGTQGKDIPKAAKWLRMGAQKGHALCQYQLGFMLEEGAIDGKPDYKQACEWYRKAAEVKYPPAMYNLASLLIEPDDTYPPVEQDIYVAIRLMEDAAALGDSSSQLKLGHLCFVGSADLDIEASLPRAIQYLIMAAHNENEPSVDAAKILGIIFSTQETNSYTNEHYDLERSIKYLKIAADSGHGDSRILLQRQQAKLKKVQQGMVIDHTSQHLQSLRLLQSQEGVGVGGTSGAASISASANPSSTTAASSSSSSTKSTAADAINTALLTSTPSVESLFLALARLHARYPEFGAPRLHAAIKQEYPHWQVSEKRVKLVMKKEGWLAEGGGNVTVTDGAIPANSATTPIPAIVLDNGTKNRLADRPIVNDLD